MKYVALAAEDAKRMGAGGCQLDLAKQVDAVMSASSDFERFSRLMTAMRLAFDFGRLAARAEKAAKRK